MLTNNFMVTGAIIPRFPDVLRQWRRLEMWWEVSLTVTPSVDWLIDWLFINIVNLRLFVRLIDWFEVFCFWKSRQFPAVKFFVHFRFYISGVRATSGVHRDSHTEFNHHITTSSSTPADQPRHTIFFPFSIPRTENCPPNRSPFPRQSHQFRSSSQQTPFGQFVVLSADAVAGLCHVAAADVRTSSHLPLPNDQSLSPRVRPVPGLPGERILRRGVRVLSLLRGELHAAVAVVGGVSSASPAAASVSGQSPVDRGHWRWD